MQEDREIQIKTVNKNKNKLKKHIPVIALNWLFLKEKHALSNK